ncbi:MAG: DUF4173 domain-containing protein [Puniceicoccales bacterium]|nr:DUF4173 domain-containing protein [Puniceicoccales bacterium]
MTYEIPGQSGSNPTSQALPPLLPTPSRETATPPQVPEHEQTGGRFWVSLALFVPVADVCLYGFPDIGAGVAALAAVTALLACWVSRARGRLAIGAVVLVASLVAQVIEPGWANLFSLVAGIGILAWTNRANALAWGLVAAAWRMATAPFRLPLLRPFAGLFPVSFRGTISGVGAVAGVVRLVLPAVLVSGLFLVLLTWGNAVLGEWAKQAASRVGAFLAELFRLDAKRIFFWVMMVFVGAVLLVPALRCVVPSAEGTLWANRRKEGSAPERNCLQWLLTLGGVNLVFLLTNTVDGVYLWARHQPPAGVGTTEYLYGGVYGLIFVTLLAGGVLALLFNGAASVTRSPWLRGLGVAWVAQNVFLISGVGFRLWLHVEQFCLTPRRVEVAFFLVLVLTGFVLLLIYVLREKSLRWLVGNNVLAVVALFFVVQFADVDAWCVESAIAKRQSASLRIDDDFLRSVGFTGWRLTKLLAEEPPEKRDGTGSYVQAVQRWEHMKHRMDERAKVSPVAETPWQAYAWRRQREARALSEALGAEAGREADAFGAWQYSWRK